MHPAPPFHWTDRDAMRAFVRERAFGALFAQTPQGPRVAHAPAVWLDDATLGFHLSRANAVTPALDGAAALFVVQGPDAYVSPDWYGLGPDEVPTWNYLAVELEGLCRRMGRAEMEAQVRQLGDEQEARLPKQPWRMDKVSPARVETLMRGIVSFRLEITEWRGTRKFGQTKAAPARVAAADGVEAAGNVAMAQLMRAPS